MRRATLVMLLAAACGKPQPGADSAAATVNRTPVAIPADSAPRAATPVKADPVQRTQETPVQSGSAGVVMRGTVGEHGFDPVTFLAITPAGGAQTRLSGPHMEALRASLGAEVWARGEMDRTTFRVDTFEVRRANDQDVADGVVSVAGTTVTVRTSSGTLTYPDAPTALRAAAGARIWITRPITGQAPSFGVIRPARQ